MRKLFARVRRAVPVVLIGTVGALAFAQEGGGDVTVDPSAIASAVTAQMTAIISAGAGLLIIGIVASVGWRYAKRFLKG